MQRILSSVITLVFATRLLACGDDSGGVAGPPGVTEGSSTTEEPPEDVDAQPGTCRKLCCADADCGVGFTCSVLDDPSGTLGVCTSGSDTTTIADAPSGATLPESCWSANEAACNALTSEGCSAGDACDYAAGEADVEPVVSCFGGDNVQAEGESCDNAHGPWCQPGWHCVGE